MLSSRQVQFSIIAIVGVSAFLFSQMIQHQSAANFLAQSEFSDPISQVDESEGNRRPGSFLRSLNLSRQQKQDLMKVKDQYRPNIRAERRKLRSEQEQLRELMASDASTAEVTQKFEAVQTIRRKLESIRFESFTAIREILTPEQRQSFLAQKQERRQQRQQRRRWRSQ